MRPSGPAATGAASKEVARYRQALREITSEPLRCALYFTALGRLYPVTELDLGAKEMA